MAENRSVVGDLMSAPVTTAAPTDSLVDASCAMVGQRIGALVVVDDDKVVGMLTERDILRATAAGWDGAAATVQQWMTSAPQTVEPQASPSEALSTLTAAGFRHLPVVDAGRLVGMVSMRDLLAVARIEPVMHPGQVEAPKGLAGVVVAETGVGDVRGFEGLYHYRQYSATELARHRTLEDVWYLLLRGQLPDAQARASFLREVGELRAVPERTAELLPQIAATAKQPLDGLRTAVSLVGAELSLRPWLDISLEELGQQALRLAAVVPTLVMALHRLSRGEQPVDPDPQLPYAANYLKMMTGQAPRAEYARAMEQYLISTIDHGFNASTFTARVITSTGADLAAALTGAIGALSGPLHGGAPSRALELLDDIGSRDRTADVVRRKVAAGERIMGFGHRVYKTQDPRSALMREVALSLGGDRVELAVDVEQTVVDVLRELKPGRELYANVEYYAGVVFEQVGLAPQLFTPTFVASRTIGWCAHVLEQAADNRLIRPTARYVGPEPPAPVPALD